MAAASPDATRQAGRSPATTKLVPGSRPDLLRRIHQALHLAGCALQAAAAQDDRSLSHDTPSPAGVDAVRPLSLAKVTAEAAMLVRCAAFLRHEDAALASALHRLARQIEPLARGEAVRVQLCRTPYRAPEFVAPHLYLCDIGHHDEGFDRFLRELLAGEAVGGTERLPNHTLECHWLEQIRTGAATRQPIDAELLARTCVALPLDVLGSSTADLYAFTHVVLYASDMGARVAPWPRPAGLLAAEADAALAAALDADNFDLAAELLWTWPMLGRPWGASARFAFELLAAVQDELGFLPGPQYVPQQATMRSEAQHEDLVLRTSYHATLVMGMLCAASLRRGQGPGTGTDDTAVDVHQLDGLLALLPASARSPRWLARQAALAPAQRCTLAPLVLNVLFRRTASTHDLPRLRLGLEAALAAGLADGPAVAQSLALLRRATALARWRHHEAAPLPVLRDVVSTAASRPRAPRSSTATAPASAACPEVSRSP